MTVPSTPWFLRRIVAAVLLIAVLGFIAWYVLCTGPRDLALYPPAETSPYKLPWPAGVERLCIQGNRGIVSHRGRGEFSFDFAMPVGSDVCAARAGVVDRIDVSHDGNGYNAPNNFVSIRHADGTCAWYLHLKKDGARVRPGDEVTQGQPIAASGNVGHSLLPHLHFHVTDSPGARSRVSFADVDRDRGIPRMFKRYTSQNRPPE